MTVEDFWNLHASHVGIECWVVDPHVDGFLDTSGNSFAVLIYFFDVGDAVMGVVLGFTVDINYSGYMSAMFFHSIFLDICWTH